MKVRILLISVLLLASIANAVTQSPVSPLSPMVLSDGWLLDNFAVGITGSIVFAGGPGKTFVDPPGHLVGGGPNDGVVLLDKNGYTWLARKGDEFPGRPELRYFELANSTRGPRRLAINSRDEVIFAVEAVECGPAEAVNICANS